MRTMIFFQNWCDVFGARALANVCSVNKMYSISFDTNQYRHFLVEMVKHIMENIVSNEKIWTAIYNGICFLYLNSNLAIPRKQQKRLWNF